jgi:DNA polymerase gamma 1
MFKLQEFRFLSGRRIREKSVDSGQIVQNRKIIKLFKYFLRFPHPATLAGMLEMSTMYLPINQNWFKYMANCDKKYDDSEIMLKKLLEKSANEACKYIDQKE